MFPSRSDRVRWQPQCIECWLLPSEAELAVIEGSCLIPLATIESGESLDQVRALAQGKRLFVHCKLGGRSARAVQMLASHGIDAINVEGGIDAWAQQVDPSMAHY